MYTKNWNEEAKKLLKNTLVQKEISIEELVEYLANIGVKETKASLNSKISRGTFSAAFLLQCYMAVDKKYITLNSNAKVLKESIPDYKVERRFSYLNTKTNVKYIDLSYMQEIKTNEDFSVISLFSGAGGLDIGLEQAGFKTIVCVENDPNCRATIKFNRPAWKLFEDGMKFENGDMVLREPGDIREIEVKELLDFAKLKIGNIDLVVGGAPCQPYSNMGKKEGKNDKSNGDLFLEFVRMVKGIKPRGFIFENVTGITQQKHNEVINYMIDSFKGTGYGISHSILNSANYGVGQRRERFILLGIKGVNNPAFPLPTHFKDEKSWDIFTKDFNYKPVSSPLPWVTLADVLKRIPKNYKKRKDYAVMNISDMVVERMKLIEQGQNFKVLPNKMRPNCWKSGKHQGNDTFGRLYSNQPAVTIRTAAYNPAKGMYIHPTENRGLDLIEMATIQDFPYEWIFKCHKSEKITLVSGGKQIGNAVPPGLAKALGLAVKMQLGGLNLKPASKLNELVEAN